MDYNLINISNHGSNDMADWIHGAYSDLVRIGCVLDVVKKIRIV